MWLDEDVGGQHLRAEVGMLVAEARILVLADVVPGPAVEAAIFYMGDVVGNEIVAEAVALVDGGPEFAGFGVDGDADGVADAGGVDALAGSVRIEFEDVGAMVLGGIVVGVVDVGARADGDEHLFVVLGEVNSASPVSAAAKAAAAREVGDVLRPAGGLEI